MLECPLIAISSSGLSSDAFVLPSSLPLFLCSLFMVFYLLVNKLLCYMNGKDWISDKGLRWAEIVLLTCSTRCFLNNLCHNRSSLRLTAFFWVSDLAVNGVKVGEMRLEGESCHDSALLAQLSGCWVVLGGQGPTAVVKLLNLVLLLNWRCKNHALNAAAGAQWFQVTYFPPTLFSWRRSSCGVWLGHCVQSGYCRSSESDPESVPGEQWRCCCSFCCPVGPWASRAAPAPSPSSSGGTWPQFCPHRSSHAVTVSCVLFCPGLW